MSSGFAAADESATMAGSKPPRLFAHPLKLGERGAALCPASADVLVKRLPA
jgi:hypothetical protein